MPGSPTANVIHLTISWMLSIVLVQLLWGAVLLPSNILVVSICCKITLVVPSFVQTPKLWLIYPIWCHVKKNILFSSSKRCRVVWLLTVVNRSVRATYLFNSFIYQHFYGSSANCFYKLFHCWLVNANMSHVFTLVLSMQALSKAPLPLWGEYSAGLRQEGHPA